MPQCLCDPTVVGGCTQTDGGSQQMGFPGSVQIFLAVTGLFLVFVSQSLCNEQQVTGETGHVSAWGPLEWSSGAFGVFTVAHTRLFREIPMYF